MAGRRLFMEVQKLEYMWVALGGKPDKEIKANQQIIDDFEIESKRIQEMLRDAKALVVRRFGIIQK